MVVERVRQTKYFESRRAELPEAPAPTVGRMLRLVLSLAGSAPVAENEPYEIYHEGANFVAHLSGQTLVVMDVSDESLRLASGEVLDLLLWIPKKGSPRLPGGHEAAAAASVLPSPGWCGACRSGRPPGGTMALPATGGCPGWTLPA